MKAVIIGGGIAGLSIGLLLKKRCWEVVVNERSSEAFVGGHAFLLSSDGMSILSSFLNEAKTPLNRLPVKLFSLKRSDGKEMIRIKLENWYSLKRVELVTFLSQFYNESNLIKGRHFSHFIYDQNKAIAAVFKNGDIEYGDIFIGADGSNSRVREIIHGQVNYTPIEVKEIVGISKNITGIISNETYLFQKFQSYDKGLAFGYIPTALDEVVWFMQYDSKLEKDNMLTEPENLRTFCFKMLDDFPDVVKDILNNNDFRNTYIWDTKDFDLISKFHQQNIVIIGDAAHLALPFTSAGTTNAIIDAFELAQSLDKYNDFEKAFSNYYNNRKDTLKKHIYQGRELKKVFLNLDKFSEREFLIPLVSQKPKNDQKTIDKKIEIKYFTDPICSTCWLFQPILRKIMIEYGNYIQINYHMGGLLPSWEEFNNSIIKSPSDAAMHWQEVSDKYKIPINSEIWIENPLNSSFPPSIAFKAAQLQDDDMAISFLRRIKELVFIEKKNIERWDVIESAALECGLDVALLRKDMDEKASENFSNDLDLSVKFNVSVFPTLIIIKDKEIKYTIKGFECFENIEKIIKELIPNVSQKNCVYDAEKLFIKYNMMTEKEFEFLSNNTETESKEILERLMSEGKLLRKETKNGIIWTYRKADEYH